MVHPRQPLAKASFNRISVRLLIDNTFIGPRHLRVLMDHMFQQIQNKLQIQSVWLQSKWAPLRQDKLKIHKI